MSSLIKMYSEGYTLEDIAFEYEMSEEDVVLSLKLFVNKQKNYVGKGVRFRFSQLVRDIVIERYKKGYSTYSLSQETGLSTAAITSFLKKAHISIRTRKELSPYKTLNWDSFERCPDCKSIRNVRHLGLHNTELDEEYRIQHSFCTSCNTEWFDDNGTTKKVRWSVIK